MTPNRSPTNNRMPHWGLQAFGERPQRQRGRGFSHGIPPKGRVCAAVQSTGQATAWGGGVYPGGGAEMLQGTLGSPQTRSTDRRPRQTEGGRDAPQGPAVPGAVGRVMWAEGGTLRGWGWGGGGGPDSATHHSICSAVGSYGFFSFSFAASSSRGSYRLPPRRYTVLAFRPVSSSSSAGRARLRAACTAARAARGEGGGRRLRRHARNTCDAEAQSRKTVAWPGGCIRREQGAGEGGRGAGPKDALEGKGPQRRPQRRLDRRLEEVAEAVGGRLLGVTNAVEAGTCHQ